MSIPPRTIRRDTRVFTRAVTRELGLGLQADALDRQYRQQGKTALWLLPLSEPISPHLDELLGKPSK
jgi:hypothetical protein